MGKPGPSTSPRWYLPLRVNVSGAQPKKATYPP